jgi:hypothetical protein
LDEEHGLAFQEVNIAGGSCEIEFDARTSIQNGGTRISQRYSERRFTGAIKVAGSIRIKGWTPGDESTEHQNEYS